jgi:histidine triad (HIT) family protein
METSQNQNDCIFCRIINGEIPSKKIYEDDEILAFHDINSQAPVHFLVIPKRHIPNIMEAKAEDTELLGRLLLTAQKLAKDQGCEEKGFRLAINCKSHGGQTVDHLHLHILGGRQMGWPPG